MSLPEVEYIWKDGELVPWAEATTHVLSHVMHYGSGVFEGIRAYQLADSGTAVFRLREHMQRLLLSAKMLYMDVGYSVDELCEATRQLIAANGLDACYVRALVYRGYGSMGLDPIPAPVNVIIACWKWAPLLGDGSGDAGVEACVSSWRQRSVNSMPPAIKASGNYVNSSLARIEANKNGYDEAILLNEQGHVTEGTGDNLFIVKGGRVLTPPSADGVLRGITRDTVIELAQTFGYEVRKVSLVRTDLYSADEVFLTGTAVEVVPLHAIDGIQVGDGRLGPVTRRLQDAFRAIVRGEDPTYESWLCRI